MKPVWTVQVALALGGFVLVAGSVLAAPSVGAAGLANLARAELVKATACSPDATLCQAPFYPPVMTAGNEVQLNRAAGWLRQAVEWAPGLTNAYRELVVAEFALGRRAEAAGWLGALHEKGESAGPLIEEGYAGRLMRGRLAAEAGDWRQAVEHYRMGLILGVERTATSDDEALFLALASHHMEAAESGANRVRSAYLAGKYLVRAGEWSAGARWIEQALRTATPSAALSDSDLAGAHASYGMALERQGLIEAAAVQYEESIAVAPERADGYVRLAELARLTGRSLTPRVADELDALQPRYILGRQSEGTGPRIAAPAEFSGGWRLVGFDLDEEALAAGPPLDTVLWWEGPPLADPSGEGWTKSGERWLQTQRVANLAPNAGFEWGAGESGPPQGFIADVYSSTFASTSAWAPNYRGSVPTLMADKAGTVSVTISGRISTALELHSGSKDGPSYRIGLVGIPVPVESSGTYLQAGWVRDAGQRGNIGRLCATGITTDEPAYIVFQRDDNPRDAWVHWANAGRPLSEKGTDRCALFLLNYESEHRVQFADILFARIRDPQALGT